MHWQASCGNPSQEVSEGARKPLECEEHSPTSSCPDLLQRVPHIDTSFFPSCWLSREHIPHPDVQVLSTADGNKELIRIDPLQRLHTLTNLSELLAGGVPGAPRTLRDDLLQSQAEEICQVSCLIWPTGHSTAMSASVAITMTHCNKWQIS